MRIPHLFSRAAGDRATIQTAPGIEEMDEATTLGRTRGEQPAMTVEVADDWPRPRTEADLHGTVTAIFRSGHQIKEHGISRNDFDALRSGLGSGWNVSIVLRSGKTTHLINAAELIMITFTLEGE